MRKRRTSIDRPHFWASSEICVDLFIQLPIAPLAGHSDTLYRRGFRAWAQAHGDPATDQVVIFTLNSQEEESLSTLWTGWAKARVVVASPYVEAQNRREEDCFETQTSQGPLIARARFEAMRCSPSSLIKETQMSAFGLLQLCQEHQGMGTSVRVCSDLREVRQRRDLPSIASLADEVLVVTRDVSTQTLANVRRSMNGSGLRSAGRPFGEAGYSAAFRRSSSMKQLVTGLYAQSRVEVGHKFAQALAAQKNRSRKREIMRIPDNSNSILNADPVPGVTQIRGSEIESVIERVVDQPLGTWDVSVESEQNPDEIAEECHGEYGVWPISFSYPTSQPLQPSKDQLSPIVPGFPYAFTNNHDYMSTYAHSAMAITHRKAGWDCFRHVEIMASGAVPLMPDAREIPSFSMVHYPKRALTCVAEQALSRGGSPTHATREQFRSYFDKHLTSVAMAKYLLRVIGVESAESVLFIDEQLPVNPEYQSTLTLIGLKQLFGSQCYVAFPGDFVYMDSPSSAAGFYGRGFGYSRALEGSSRTTSEVHGTVGFGLNELENFDLVVIGSVSRNAELTTRVLRSMDPRRVVLIHGEDTPPINSDYEQLVDSGAHVFVRSIYR